MKLVKTMRKADIQRVNNSYKKKLAASGGMLLLVIQMIISISSDLKEIEISWNTELCHEIGQIAMLLLEPNMIFITQDTSTQQSVSPLLKYLKECSGIQLLETVEWNQIIKVNNSEKQNEDIDEAEVEQEAIDENMKMKEQISNEELEIQAREENEKEQEIVGKTAFIPQKSKTAVYSREQLLDADFIKKEFYTVDATTSIKKEQLDYGRLSGFDATLKQEADNPQILVYHTHSQECYADSNPADASTTIMGVGEYLSALLRQEYGFNVIHHLGMYDVEGRDYAYNYAADGLEQVLQEYPTIEVIIDLHRDEVKEGTKLLTNIQGMDMAKFMFFNGLCYTNELGELTSLPNQYIQDNLAFAFQLQLAAQEYYPGLTRRIYLKGYRYNMHYRAKSLLIELGAQTNTVEEAMNSCKPLAHIIAMVLKGEVAIDN